MSGIFDYWVWFCFLLWKELKKKKMTKEEEKKKSKVADKTPEPKKREKKVYDLPGQKRDPPEEVLCCFCFSLGFHL